MELTNKGSVPNVGRNSGQFQKSEMKTFSLSEAKAKLSELIEKVRTSDEEIVITKNGRAAGVLVSPDEYESWKETESVRADASLMREIKRGLLALKRRRANLYTLEELLK
jgi:prevent-host-death family protein